MPSAQRLLTEHGIQAREVQATGPAGRVLKEDVLRHVERKKQEKSDREPAKELQRETPAPAPCRLQTPATEQSPSTPLATKKRCP